MTSSTSNQSSEPTNTQSPEPTGKLAGWERNPLGGLGRKADAEKPRFDLIDAYTTEVLAKVLTFGAWKYGEENWRHGIGFKRLLAAAKRHINSIEAGEDLDEETSLPHAAHAMCCMMFLAWTQKHMPEMDDRWDGVGSIRHKAQARQAAIEEKSEAIRNVQHESELAKVRKQLEEREQVWKLRTNHPLHAGLKVQFLQYSGERCGLVEGVIERVYFDDSLAVMTSGLKRCCLVRAGDVKKVLV